MKFRPKDAILTASSLAMAVLLMSLVVSLRPAAAQTPPANDPNEEAFRRISNKLLCQCGCGYMVLSCNHLDCSSATYIRKTIRTSLAEGKNDDTILASFVEQYGPRILPEPPRQGFTWLGWIMPFAALVLGGGAVSYILWRWKTGQLPDEPTPSDGGTAGLELPAAMAKPELLEKYRAQIDHELEKD